MSYGMAGFVGFAKESSGGTAVAADTFLESMSETLTSNIDRFETANIVNRLSEPNDQAGVRRIGGNVVAAFHPVDAGHFLFGVLGVNTVTEVLSGFLYTHEMSPRTSDWDDRFPQQPYTFEIGRDVTSAAQYAGCVFNTLGIAYAINQDVRLTAGLIGVSEAYKTPATVTYTTSPADVFAFDTASISLAGAANAQIESLNVNINNNLEGVPTLNNSTNIQKIRRTNFQQVRVSGSISFDDIVEALDFKNQTKRQLTVSVTRADSFQLILDIPQMVYTAFPLGTSGRGRNIVQFEGRAEYNVGSGNAFKATLTTVDSFY